MKKTKLQEFGIEFAEGIFNLVYSESQPLGTFLRPFRGEVGFYREELREYLTRRPTKDETWTFIDVFRSELRRLADHYNYSYTEK